MSADHPQISPFGYGVLAGLESEGWPWSANPYLTGWEDGRTPSRDAQDFRAGTELGLRLRTLGLSVVLEPSKGSM